MPPISEHMKCHQSWSWPQNHTTKIPATLESFAPLKKPCVISVPCSVWCFFSPTAANLPNKPLEWGLLCSVARSLEQSRAETLSLGKFSPSLTEPKHFSEAVATSLETLSYSSVWTGQTSPWSRAGLTVNCWDYSDFVELLDSRPPGHLSSKLQCLFWGLLFWRNLRRLSFGLEDCGLLICSL